MNVVPPFAETRPNDFQLPVTRIVLPASAPLVSGGRLQFVVLQKSTEFCSDRF